MMRGNKAVTHDIEVLLKRDLKKDVMWGVGGYFVEKDKDTLSLWFKSDCGTLKLCVCRKHDDGWKAEFIWTEDRGTTMAINAMMKALGMKEYIYVKKDRVMIKKEE